MNINNINFSKKELKQYGLQARAEFSSVLQNCGEICDHFEGVLIDEGGLPYKPRQIAEKYGVKQVRVGPNGEEKHYVFYIDGKFIEGYTPGETILIDLSFDQFNESNKNTGKISVAYGKRNELEKVRILSENDTRRSQYRNVGALF